MKLFFFFIEAFLFKKKKPAASIFLCLLVIKLGSLGPILNCCWDKNKLFIYYTSNPIFFIQLNVLPSLNL